jgi:hypothetical protein
MKQEPCSLAKVWVTSRVKGSDSTGKEKAWPVVAGSQLVYFFEGVAPANLLDRVDRTSCWNYRNTSVNCCSVL